jgi:hypothetical protein
MTEDCVFCDHDRLRAADLYFENDFCIYASTRDPRDPPDVIPGCGGIVPKVHRASPFDLTASTTSRWPAIASDRELKIPPTGDLIRGVPAPAGTWPDHETGSRGSREGRKRRMVTAPDRVLSSGSRSIRGRPGEENRMPSPSSTGRTYTRISSTSPRCRH